MQLHIDPAPVEVKETKEVETAGLRRPRLPHSPLTLTCMPRRSKKRRFGRHQSGSQLRGHGARGHDGGEVEAGGEGGGGAGGAGRGRRRAADVEQEVASLRLAYHGAGKAHSDRLGIAAAHRGPSHSAPWHNFVSTVMLLFINYYTLFKMMRDYLVAWKVYKAENMIQDKNGPVVN
ncbi:hypothetical protein MSG28_009848 [Choristoneura fumiferana]|uniref:Uncharacterized protein n=1 Tax=Choristoneura fumiferana TaxID=7141 RepID=A0ACC0JCQ6_CHOFU|nr:hypothetical protein MSG28_009848 [Choristoneura fumiferana]